MQTIRKYIIRFYLVILTAQNINFQLCFSLSHNHIDKCIGKAYTDSHNLYICRSFLNLRTKLLMCDSSVLSLSNYSDSVYGACLDTYKKRLQEIQTSSSRICFGVTRGQHISIQVHIQIIIDPFVRVPIFY